jgi:beta-glucosidase
MGEALADVLLGAAEPGGRLPVTLPAAESDCPVLRAMPVDGVLRYNEGLLIGYPAVRLRARAGLHHLGIRVAAGLGW